MVVLERLLRRVLWRLQQVVALVRLANAAGAELVLWLRCLKRHCGRVDLVEDLMGGGERHVVGLQRRCARCGRIAAAFALDHVS